MKILENFIKNHLGKMYTKYLKSKACPYTYRHLLELHTEVHTQSKHKWLDLWLRETTTHAEFLDDCEAKKLSFQFYVNCYWSDVIHIIKRTTQTACHFN